MQTEQLNSIQYHYTLQLTRKYAQREEKCSVLAIKTVPSDSLQTMIKHSIINFHDNDDIFVAIWH
jgi:hypothetical protein